MGKRSDGKPITPRQGSWADTEEKARAGRARTTLILLGWTVSENESATRYPWQRKRQPLPCDRNCIHIGVFQNRDVIEAQCAATAVRARIRITQGVTWSAPRSRSCCSGGGNTKA